MRDKWQTLQQVLCEGCTQRSCSTRWWEGSSSMSIAFDPARFTVSSVVWRRGVRLLSIDRHHNNAIKPTQPTRIRRPDNTTQAAHTTQCRRPATVSMQECQSDGGLFWLDTTDTATRPNTSTKARRVEEQNSEQFMETYRSLSQHDHNQQRPATHGPTYNTTTQSTRRDSKNIHEETITITMVQKNTRSLTKRRGPRAHPRAKRA